MSYWDEGKIVTLVPLIDFHVFKCSRIFIPVSKSVLIIRRFITFFLETWLLHRVENITRGPLILACSFKPVDSVPLANPYSVAAYLAGNIETKVTRRYRYYEINILIVRTCSRRGG